MTNLELFTRFIFPGIIALSAVCFLFVIAREALITKRRAICMANYWKYSKLYHLKPAKPLIGVYVVLAIACSVCIVLDIMSGINRVQIIPEAILLIALAGLVAFELHIGYGNKDLSAYDSLKKTLQIADSQASNIRETIHKNEKKKDELKEELLKTAEKFNAVSPAGIKEKRVLELFAEIESYIQDAYNASKDYRASLRKFFDGSLKSYLATGSGYDLEKGLGKQLLITDAEFDSRLNKIKETMAKIVDDQFAVCLDGEQFLSEDKFFSALAMTSNPEESLKGKDIQILKQTASFATKDKMIEMLTGRGLLTCEWCKAIGGISEKNWWFIDAVFTQGTKKEMRQFVCEAITNDDVESIYHLADYPYTLSPEMFMAMDALNVNTYAYRCLKALKTVGQDHRAYLSRANILESMCVVLYGLSRDSFFHSIMQRGSFIENEEYIRQSYAEAKRRVEEAISLSKKIMVEFNLNYPGWPFAIDKTKVSQLFKEYVFGLDEQNLASLSLLLVTIMRESNQNYQSALVLSRGFGIIGGQEEKGYVANLKKYVCNTNLIKTKRIVSRIESKRCLLDEVLAM